jgi:hypothetical protein
VSGGANPRLNGRALAGAALAVLVAGGLSGVGAADAERIRPYDNNPYYWQYKGEPVLLLGGSWQDNLFNHPEGLEEHLDLLVSVGGNYIRNTMSSRSNPSEGQTPTPGGSSGLALGAGADNLPWAFAINPEAGLYDLSRMGEVYWERFERLLALTAARDIIVQLELFDRFDYARLPWQFNPFNPRNNLSYAEESRLPEVINSHPGQRQNPFFRTVPALENNTVVLQYQHAFVDKLLSLALPYGHVLYCVSNETNEAEEWGAYWAEYIREAARRASVEVHVTEMWEPGDMAHPMHRRTFGHPERYTFVDISQNNGGLAATHWERIQYVRELLSGHPRPINNVKIYTFAPEPALAVHRWWRNILGGCASVRFHRPHPLESPDDHEKFSHVGLGLSPLAQAQIRSARRLTEELGWPSIEPSRSLAELVHDHPFAVVTERTHLAYTRAADGQARLYINGKEAAAADIGGDLSSWDLGMRLALGNEISGERGWRGICHEVALYDRALAPQAIAQHVAAGTAQPR